MSYFGETLRSLMGKNSSMKAVQLAVQSGVSQPTLSRYLSGFSTPTDPEDIARLARAVSSDPMQQAELVRAHLLDECKGPGSEKIQILIVDAPPRPAQILALNAQLEEDLLVIREWLFKDANVCEVIQGLANLLRKGDCRVESEFQAVQDAELSAVISEGTNSCEPAGKQHRRAKPEHALPVDSLSSGPGAGKVARSSASSRNRKSIGKNGT